MTTSEKVAYLKGLADGLGLGGETKEEKLLAAIIETLECIAEDIEDLEDTVFDLGEDIDAISDDLSAVESVVFDECDCDDECCCDDDFEDECCHDHGHAHEGSCCHGHHEHGGSCCHGHHGPLMYEVTCPACENTITIDEDVLNLGSIECPNCGGLLEFDFEGSAPETDGSEDK